MKAYHLLYIVLTGLTAAYVTMLIKEITPPVGLFPVICFSLGYLLASRS